MSHRCPGPECTLTVPDEMLACRRHWYSVPVKLRRALWRAWRAGEVEEHARLRAECIAAMEAAAR